MSQPLDIFKNISIIALEVIILREQWLTEYYSALKINNDLFSIIE